MPRPTWTLTGPLSAPHGAVLAGTEITLSLVPGVSRDPSGSDLRAGSTIAVVGPDGTLTVKGTTDPVTLLASAPGAPVAYRLSCIPRVLPTVTFTAPEGGTLALDDIVPEVPAPIPAVDAAMLRAEITAGDAATLAEAKAHTDALTPDLTGYATTAELAAALSDARDPYADHGSVSGVVSWAGRGTHVATLTGDATATVTGLADGDIVSVVATGTGTLTLGTSTLTAPGRLTLQRIRGVLERVTAGTTTAALATPTVSVAGVTSTTITVAYASTDSGVTAWQYRLDGGTPGVLDGTSPDTIAGLSPSQTGVVQVRCTIDGATWSTWAGAAYETSAAAASAKILPLSWTDANPATPSGSAGAGWTYTAGGAAASLNSADAIPPGGDGYFDVQMGSTLTYGGGIYLADSFCFSTPASAWSGSPDVSQSAAICILDGKYRIGPPGGTTGTATGITAAAGDVLRLRKTGPVVDLLVSKDAGSTFTQLGTHTLGANTRPCFLAIWLPAAGVISWAKSVGTTRWGVKTVLNAALTLAITGTNITKSGSDYTCSPGTGYANSTPTGFTRSAIEWGVTLTPGVDGPACSLTTASDTGGTVGNTGSTGAYVRIAADGTLAQKAPYAGEAAVAGSAVTSASRFVAILEHPSASDWQRAYAGFSPDGVHQWKPVRVTTIAGGTATPNTHYFGISGGTGAVVAPTHVGTYT